MVVLKGAVEGEREEEAVGDLLDMVVGLLSETKEGFVDDFLYEGFVANVVGFKEGVKLGVKEGAKLGAKVGLTEVIFCRGI